MRNQTLAFVFPGQGSQKVGMLADLATGHPVVRDTFLEAGEVLQEDLWSLAQEGPAEALDQTRNTQPALLSAGVAVWRAWNSRSPVLPETLAGHSLGEYTALVAAGVLDFTDAVRAVRARADFMQEAVPVGAGAMAAVIGLADEQVVTCCAEAAAGEVVEAVNFNAPGQVVIAGSAAAVARAGERCKAAGAKRCLPLPVSVPSHCALMKPAAERLQAFLQDVPFAAPAIPVLQNVDARAESDPDRIRAKLVEQLYRPVRWVDTVRAMHDAGIRTVLECGPGKVLSGLNKRIERELEADSLEQLDRYLMDVSEEGGNE